MSSSTATTTEQPADRAGTRSRGLAQIVLSTFNGGEYLASLLDSLFAQDYPTFELLVRDDGSTDETVDLLRSYDRTHASVRIVVGDHVGFVQSFATALALASPAADYVALCDQDDVWQPDKLSRGVAALDALPVDTPALYCSRLAIVDERLTHLALSPLPAKGLSFRNALVESQAVGCTIVLNRAAGSLLRGFPPEVVSHDWWIYLVVSAFGTTIYDDEPTILFRKHSGNVFGITIGRAETWRTKLREFRRAGEARPAFEQARALERIYRGSLTEQHRGILERFLAGQGRIASRLRYAASPEVYRQSRRDHFLLKAKIALGRV